MRKLNFNQKIGLGLILISLSILLRHLSPDHSIPSIAFLQGFCTGLGILLMIVGAIQRKKFIR